MIAFIKIRKVLREIFLEKVLVADGEKDYSRYKTADNG
jgi:hypothetical protein